MSCEYVGYTIGSSGPITEVDGFVKITISSRRMRLRRLVVLMHELRMRLVVLREPVHLRRDDRCEQTHAVLVERHTLAGRRHLLEQGCPSSTTR